ncbi:helix-turn-helix domain-containing protein [Serratia symbiotica]|uniref:helix-turn-helix domain-containing protein n=1 Tax=Serratia symbiotica TaxID=138074 RepID=UPI001CF0B626|nr:helix-turn-helix domain-containing protein [Serratia symbiotica]
MKKETFVAAGKAAYGNRWQTEVAAALGCNDRTVRRWISGESRLPPLIAADVVRILTDRLATIEEALAMITEKFLMNPLTGSVATEDEWLAEMPTWETTSDGLTPQQQLDTLIEVVKDKDDHWVEVK